MRCPILEGPTSHGSAMIVKGFVLLTALDWGDGAGMKEISKLASALRALIEHAMMFENIVFVEKRLELGRKVFVKSALL